MVTLSASLLTFASTIDLTLARRGGGGLARGAVWLYHGVTTGNPAALGVGGLLVGGGGLYIWSQMKND